MSTFAAPRQHLVQIIGAILCTVFVHVGVSADDKVALAIDTQVSAQTLGGQSVSLDDLLGKITIVNFWASWCYPCRYEMPLLHRLVNEFHADGLRVVAIAIDDTHAAVQAYQDEYQFNFPVLFDDTGEAKRAFGVTAVPETFIIDTNGNMLTYQSPGDDQPQAMIANPIVWQTAHMREFLATLLHEP